MQPQATAPGLFQRTPPAIFPPIFGLFGLGMAWRNSASLFTMPDAVGEVILGAVTLLYLFALVAYLTKVVKRPGVFAEDLKTLPGRAGLATMMMAGMLMAATILPYGAGVARLVLIAAIGGHVILLLVVINALLRGPGEARHVTPVWHLMFVGLILSPPAAIALGWIAYSTAILAGAVVIALAIWAISLRQMMQKEMPAPLRPTQAIHLAPAAVLGTVAMMLGYNTLALVFGVWAIIVLAYLIVRARWITAAGFSPFWGAFTFPLAAFSTVMQLNAMAGAGEVFRILGGLSLVAATLIIPVITWKIMMLWAKGVLATKTNAASA